jgi:hypothetical protein
MTTQLKPLQKISCVRGGQVIKPSFSSTKLASISFFKTTHPLRVCFFFPLVTPARFCQNELKVVFCCCFTHRVKPWDECFTEIRDPQVGAQGVSNFCKFSSCFTMGKARGFRTSQTAQWNLVITSFLNAPIMGLYLTQRQFLCYYVRPKLGSFPLLTMFLGSV